MASQLKTLADRYILEEEIARGGMGSVWRARDEVLARTVAVKLLLPSLSSDSAFLERFRREALAAAHLAHPNIVSIYDTGSEQAEGEDGEHHYIVMEYCGRGTLADVAAAGPSAPDRVAAIGTTVCSALGYAHANEVVHRDVKPANVLITDDGALKVGDFGIAKAAFVTSDITTTGAILGTVTYFSPEQARGQEPDARSDLYSLGVVLYELATGRPPFPEENQIAIAMRHLRDEPPPPRSIRAGIPRPLESVILKALNKDPDERYASAQEMREALEASVGTTSVIPARRRPQSPRRERRASTSTRERGTDLKWIWGVLAIAVVVVGLAVAIPPLLDRGDEPSSESDAGGRGDSAVAPAEALSISGADDFDPYGDDEEHSEEVEFAYDGEETTAWETESYSSPLEAQGKPGVGLVFDLGDARSVSGLELEGDLGNFEIRYSDSVDTDAEAFDLADEGDRPNIEFDETIEARYWLVWITELPEEIGTASIAEVSFLGS